MNEEDKHWILAHQFPKFGPLAFRRLLRHFPSMKEAYNGDEGEFIEAGIKKDTAREFIHFREQLEEERIIRTLSREEINITKLTDEAYPQLLSRIYDPPPLLYWKGDDISALNQKTALAAVGSRKCSLYGRQVTEDIVRETAKNGMTIISGLALGVDTLVHMNSLAESGTAAILASGLDGPSIYPAQNRGLAKKILENGGLLISEFPPGTRPAKYHFPQRNRIISGLSRGVLVIEAAERSGALITAEFASEEGREVFAVPGNIYSPSSKGTNKLIKKGAHPTTSAEDILEIFNMRPKTEGKDTETKTEQLSDTEQKVIQAISFEPTSVDDIIKKSRLDTSAVTSTLTILEIKGIIKDMGGKKYVLNQ